MYNDIVRDCGMLNSNKFNYKGKEITQQECVDRILEGLKLDLTLNDFDKKREDKNIKEKIDDVMPLFLLCLNTLWW